MSIEVLESEIDTRVSSVQCASCKSEVAVTELLDKWAEGERDMCPRCGSLFEVVLP